jgi:hypothetical protein
VVDPRQPVPAGAALGVGLRGGDSVDLGQLVVHLINSIGGGWR